MAASLKKSFLIYTSTNVLSTALPFIFLPFLTYYLSPEDYGILTNYSGLLSICLPIAGFNFVPAFTRQFYKDEIDIARYTQTGISFQLLLSLAVSFILFVFESGIFSITGIEPLYLRIVGLYCLSFNVSEILLSKWRLEDKVWHFAFMRIVRAIIEISLTLFLIIEIGLKYEGRIYAIVFASLFGGLAAIVLLSKEKHVGRVWDKSSFKHLIKYCTPLIPHAFGSTLLVYSDKLMISSKLGLDQNGIYSVAFQIGLVIGLIQNSFNQAWTPWFFSKLKQNDAAFKNRIVRLTHWYFLALLLMTGLLYLCKDVIYHFLNSSFETGAELIGWIAVGFVFNGMYKMKVNYLFYAEKTIVIGATTMVTVLINLILNYFLIDSFGLTGAAIATAISLGAQWLIIWYFQQRYMKMPWFRIKSSK